MLKTLTAQYFLFINYEGRKRTMPAIFIEKNEHEVPQGS